MLFLHKLHVTLKLYFISPLVFYMSCLLLEIMCDLLLITVAHINPVRPSIDPSLIWVSRGWDTVKV
ncbi:unnamed protein product [Tenebrio molitor]|nr:unnamed protein product [Tenebrio molitor]